MQETTLPAARPRERDVDEITDATFAVTTYSSQVLTMIPEDCCPTTQEVDCTWVQKSRTIADIAGRTCLVNDQPHIASDRFTV